MLSLLNKTAYSRVKTNKVYFVLFFIILFSLPLLRYTKICHTPSKAYERAKYDFSTFKTLKSNYRPPYFNSQPIYYRWSASSNSFEKIERRNLSSIKFTNNSPSYFSDQPLNQYRYLLQGGILSVRDNSKTVWRSPQDWWIDSYKVANSTNDNELKLNLSVWKKGSFGDNKPIWVKQNDDSIKNHFFVYIFRKGKISPFWQSSNLDVPNCKFYFVDIDNDSNQELIVLEGNYSTFPYCSGEYVAIWRWDQWHFVNLWRSEKSNYSNISNLSRDGQNYIKVEHTID